jgi:hypothetical protein
LRFNCFERRGFERWLLLFLVIITASAGADKDKTEFKVKPVLSYPHHQVSENITIAAQAMETDDETREAFGKVNPNRYGILPVLIVFQNGGPDAVRVDHMKLVYNLPDGTHVEATPAQDVRFLNGVREPKGLPGPTGGIAIKRPSKNPLAEWEIEGRAFVAKMVPAGQSASGFAYFQVPQSSAAASVYISGLVNAVTGKELYYFEISMSGN